MCALVLGVCVHREELAPPFSRARPGDLVFSRNPARQSLQSPSCAMISLGDPVGISVSTDWNVSLLPGKSSFVPREPRGGRIHQNQGACLELPPIITSRRTGRRLEHLPAVSREGERQVPLPAKATRGSQAHRGVQGPVDTSALKATLAPLLACTGHFPA